MSDKTVSVGLKIDGDSSGAKAAINSTEKELINLAETGKTVNLLDGESVKADELATELVKVQAQMRAMVEASKDAGIPLAAIESVDQVKTKTVAATTEAKNLGNALEKDAQALTKIGSSAAETTQGLTRAARAAEGIDAAFKTLGIKPLQDVRAETERLQAALATIKASGVIGPDQERAVAAFKAKLAELRGEVGNLPPAAGAARTALGQVGSAAETSSTLLGGMASKVAGAVAALASFSTVSNIAADVIKTGAAFETLEARLGNLLGSAEAAKTAMGNIKALATSTPFEVTALADSFIKLTAMGLEPSMAQMKSLADTAATLGGGTEVLTGVTTALGQAWAKGKLQGEEIMQLAERGVPIWDVLAQATGKNTAELQKMSEAGELGRGTILKLIDALGTMNAGASEKMMATFSGAVSNAKDALAEFYDMIAKAGALEYLTQQIQGLLAEFERMKNTGELQAEAKRLSDAFVRFGEGVRLAVDAVQRFSTIIKLAAEVFIAWRLAAAAAVPAIASVGVASAATGTAVTALAVASEKAALGTRAMAGAMQLLKGAGMLAVFEWSIGKVVELTKVMGEAREASKALAKAEREALEPPAVNGAKEAIKAIVTETEAARFQLTEYQRAMAAAQEQGKTTGDALGDMVKKADFNSVKGVADFLDGMESVRKGAQATGNEIQHAIQDRLNKMSANDLREFGVMAQSAFNQGRISAEQLAAMLNGGVDAALKGLGSSLEVSVGGMTAKFIEVSKQIGVVETSYDRLKAAGQNAGAVLKTAFEGGLNTAKSVQDLEGLAVVIRKAGEAGRLSKQEVSDFLDRIKEKTDLATPGVNSLAEAFKTLGMKSPAELAKTAKAAEDAFNVIKQGSGYSAAELTNVREAFKRMAEASIAANGGIASDALKAQAGLYGLKIEADSAGKAIISLADSTRVSGDAAAGAAGGHDRLAGSLEKVAGSASVATKALKDLSYQEMVNKGMSQSEISNQLSDRQTSDAEKAAGVVKRNVTTDSIDWRTEAIKRGATSEQATRVAEVIGDEITREMETLRQKYAGMGMGDDPTSYRLAFNGAMERALGKAMDTAKNPSTASLEKQTSTTTGQVDPTLNGGYAVKATTVSPVSQSTTVNINFSGKSTAVNVASAADASALVSMLKELESSASRASL